jgi:DNA-binding NarL/FixJ family response regulator
MTTRATTTVVIADDHPLVRRGLRAVFDGTTDIELVAEAADGAEAVAAVREHRPDVVLMDLDMPRLDGLAATSTIAAEAPATAVLVLTMFDDDETVFAAMGAGAIGYLLKGSDGDEILDAVRSAASGQAVFGPALATRLRAWFHREPAPPSAAEAFPELTDRELDILDGLAAGLTNAEIGERLHLSAKTIANNVSTILTKLQVSQRGQAIVRARDAGLGSDRLR